VASKLAVGTISADRMTPNLERVVALLGAYPRKHELVVTVMRQLGGFVAI
jgi:hypothetical protein